MSPTGGPREAHLPERLTCLALLDEENADSFASPRFHSPLPSLALFLLKMPAHDFNSSSQLRPWVSHKPEASDPLRIVPGSNPSSTGEWIAGFIGENCMLLLGSF